MLTKRHFWKTCVAGLALCISLRAPALGPHYPLQHYSYQSWQTDDGLPQNTVRSVLQTHDGYLWLATEGSLVRFDGTQFTVFDTQTTPQLGGSFINKLFEDKQQILWIATSNGLVRKEGQNFRSFSTEDGLPSNRVWSIVQGRDGTLWVFTGSGLARYAGGRFEAVPGMQALTASSTLVEAADGGLWINTAAGLERVNPRGAGSATQGLAGADIQAIAAWQGKLWVGRSSGLQEFSSGTMLSFPLPVQLGNNVTALLTARDGHLWIGTAKGLGEYDGKEVHVYLDGPAPERISNLYEDSQHAIWAATSQGIARIFAGRTSVFTPKEGLSGNHVQVFYEDREGNLWMGMESGGLSVLRDRKFTTYTSQDGLTDDLVRSVYQARTGAIWIGTNGGGVDALSNGIFSAIPVSPRLSSNVVLAIAEDAGGNTWVGTPDGLNRIHNGRVKVFTSADGLADDFVRSLYLDREGALWVGTRHGLSVYRDGSFTSYSALDGLGGDLIGAVLEDADGSYWIGTSGGLTHFSKGRFTNFTTSQGLSSNVVPALYQDKSGTLWIGTNGGGLNAYRDGKLEKFPSGGTHLPENIYGILEDAGGHLWFSSDKGVFRAGRQELDDFAAGRIASIHADAYGTADGMRISECSSGGHPSVWKAQDGTLWFATLRGVSTVDPAHLPVNRMPPLVAVEQLSVDDTLYSAHPGLDISPGHTRFSFQYAGLSFAAPQKVRFRYKLDGLDKDWVDAGTRRVAYYTNIPAGQHVFHVMAVNNDGVWSEQAASLAFRLRPHFYQTYWFYLMLLAALALAVYQGYLWRVRSVESRFGAVLAERTRIAREIHDTLAQGFVAVSVQLEVVSRLLATSGRGAQEHLEQARELTRECLAEARASIWNLRSHEASGNDLATTLTQAAERITASSSTKARIEVHGPHRPLYPKVEAELARIGQEAMTNVVRHADAKHVDVKLLFQEKHLRMTIQDDGRGFDTASAPDRQNGHFGITGMRERAEQIGARLAVESAPGEGTRIEVEVSI